MIPSQTSEIHATILLKTSTLIIIEYPIRKSMLATRNEQEKCNKQETRKYRAILSSKEKNLYNKYY
jgi:hypothetical protein